MSGFAKLLSPKGRLWIVVLLVGALNFFEELQATVAVATIFPSGSGALRNQKWLGKAIQVTAPSGSMVDESTLLYALFCEGSSGFAMLLGLKANHGI